MVFNISVFVLALCVVFWRYTRNYEAGFLLATTLLVIVPDSVALDVSSALPLISLSRVLIIIMILFWAKTGFAARRGSPVPFFKFQCAIAAFYLLSTMISPFLWVAGKRWCYYVLESLVLFWVVQSTINNSQFAERVVKAIGLGLATVAVMGLAERYLGWRIFELGAGGRYEGGADRFTWVASGEVGSVVTTYKHRILFGTACAIGAVKFLIDSAVRQNYGSIKASLAMAFLCGANLYFSNSRGPWLAFALCSMILVLLLPKWFTKTTALLAVLAAAVILVRPGVLESISNMTSSTLDADSLRGGSFRWRAMVMNLALSKLGEADPVHWLLGYGGGSQIMTEFGTLEVHPGLSLPAQSWDCELAIILYERGVLGLLGIVGLYAMAVVMIGRRIKSEKTQPRPALVFAFSALFILFFMMSNVAIYAPQLIYIGAYSLAIGSSLLAGQETAG